jgi:hypothetical protein
MKFHESYQQKQHWSELYGQKHYGTQYGTVLHQRVNSMDRSTMVRSMAQYYISSYHLKLLKVNFQTLYKDP